MIHPKNATFNDRQAASVAAKKALLAKLKPKPTITDPHLEARKAEREFELEILRDERRKEREVRSPGTGPARRAESGPRRPLRRSQATPQIGREPDR